MSRKQAENKKGLGRILKRMVPKCIKASFPLWLAMIGSDIFYSLTGVINVWLLQRFFDDVTNAVSGIVSVETVMISFLFLGFTRFLELCLNFFSNFMPFIFSEKVRGKLTFELHEKIGRLSPIEFEDTIKLDYINKATQGCGAAIDFVCRFGYIFTFYAAYIIAMIIYLLALNKLLALMILCIFIPVGISQLIRTKVYHAAEDLSAPIRRQYDYYESCLVNREYFKETRLLGAFSYFKKLYLDALDALQLIKYKAAFKTGMLDLLFSIFTIFGYGGVLFLLVRCLLHGDISIGAFAAVFATIDRLYHVMDSMMRYSVGNMAAEYGTINNYLNFLELEEDSGKDYKPDSHVEVELNHVSFAYPSDPGELNAIAGRQFTYDHYGNLRDSDLLKDMEKKEEKQRKDVVKDCSLHIKKGETIAIVGENGSGKSTMIRLITGLYDPQKGCVTYNGMDISQFRKSSLYRRTSAVFQKYQRYQMTLQDNIGISNVAREPKEGELDKICKSAGIQAKDMATYPKGYDTMLSREFDGVDLSGGQWQRVAIGRAFYRIHDLIVLDEPTSAIDPYEETRIYNQFAEISKDKTAVIVTHRLGSVKLADRIVVMKEGKIVQQGTHQELIAQSNGEYARLYKSQEQWYIR